MSSGRVSNKRDVKDERMQVDPVDDRSTNSRDYETLEETQEMLNIHRNIKPKAEMAKMKKMIQSQREKDLKSFRKARETFMQAERRMRYFQERIELADQQLGEIDRQIVLDFKTFGFP